jgi:glycosyltransferase involved in cell wall biosynthesis
MWGVIEWMGNDRAFFNMVWTVVVPDGVTLDGVCAALRRTVARYDTLRTTYLRRGEELLQVVAGDGVVTVAVYVAPPGGLDRIRKEVAAVLGRSNIDSATEWPLRVAVVLQDGAPRSLVLAVNHMALDLYGWRVVEESLTAFLADPAVQLPPHDGWEPLDQAAFETSPKGRAVSDAALRRWRDLLHAAPPTLFDFAPAQQKADRFWTLQLQSRALAVALPVVAQRLHDSSSAVLLTAMSEVFGGYTGHDEAVVQVLVSNRLIRDNARMAGYLCWDSPLHVDLRDLSFDTAIRRVFTAALDAYQHGLYRPAHARAVRREVEHTRGAHIDLGCHFNDRRERTATAPQGTTDLTTLREHTRIVFLSSHPRIDTRLHLHAMDEAPDSIELELTCDTHYVPVQAMHEILHAIEALIITAADRDLTPEEITASVKVTPPSRGAGWVRRHRGWVNLHAVRRLWTDLVGEQGGVFAEPGTDGHHRLTGYHATESPAQNLHRAFLDLIGDRTDVHTPDVYIRAAAAPPHVHDEAAWRQAPVLSSNSGRPPADGPIAPHTTRPARPQAPDHRRARRENRRSRALFVSHDMLWPTIGGGRTRCMKVLLHALRESPVDLVVVAPAEDVARDCQAIPALPGLTTHVFVDESTPGPAPARTCRPAFDLVREHASRDGGYDVVHIEGHYLLDVVPPELHDRTILVEQNIESQLLEQRAALGEPVTAADIVGLRERELRAWRRAGAVVTLSPEDEAVVLARDPSVVPQLITNGWDHVRSATRPRPDPGGMLTAPRLLFVADYDYAPNRDAFRWLAREVFPRIRQEIRDATLVLGGVNLPADLARLGGSCHGALVAGYIADLDAELDAADVVLIPLRIGGGVKVKTIEAIRRARLVVSTTIGGTGVPEPLRAAMCVGDDAGSFSEHVIRLCRNPEERRRRVAELVNNQEAAPTWAQTLSQLMRLWSKVAHQAHAPGPEPPTWSVQQGRRADGDAISS